jgi:hypothetical protein
MRVSTLVAGLTHASIRRKNYFEIPYSEPRSYVEPSFADRTLLLYNEFLKGVRCIQSTAVEATATEVIAASGERIPYDFLVITTGTTFTSGATKEERLKEFEDGITQLDVLQWQQCRIC